MATGVLEWFSGTKKEEGFGIAPGVVTDNLNILGEGRVQVHIPAFPDLDPGRGSCPWEPEEDAD